MKTEIKFYGGLNTIGGVVMSIVYGKERLLLEMGTAYNPASDMFDGFVLNRIDHYLEDELKLRRAPLVDGLYSKKYLKNYDLISSEDSDLHTSIFITHMHLDHMSCMGLAGDEVDIYLSEPAKRLEEALETVNKGVKTLRTVGYKTLDPNHIYQLGDIRLTPYLLNDKSYQDYSFYIETPDLKLHYTGDLLLHGDYVDEVWKEMEDIRSKNVDVLVVDCTTFMDSTMKMLYGDENHPIIGHKELPQGMLNKSMVDDALCAQLASKSGLCVFNYYEREMEDVMKFMKMADKTNRTICFEPETAYLIWKFFGKPVNIYIPDFDGYNTEWFKELTENNPVISKKDIFEQPSRYLIQTTYAHIMELFDLPNQDACYLHSGGTPIGAYDPAYQNMLRIIEKAGFAHINFFMNNYFTHAYPPQAQYYVDQIDALVTIPSHGYNPERMNAAPGRERLLPELNKTYIFNGKKLVEVQ